MFAVGKENSSNCTEAVTLEMYEAGGEEESGFHVFNLSTDHYHRAEVLQRTGAIDITCSLEKVVHGAMSADSERYATLIHMQWFFQPKRSRRISEATIELLFDPSSGGGDVEVEKISFLGVYSLMPTRQEETITKAGEATVGANQVANLSLNGKWEKNVTTTTSDAITLSGGKRVINNIPPSRIATWTVFENQSQPTGIPSSLRIAVLVSREDEEEFSCNLSFVCQTDKKTAARNIFKKIPQDDPIIFQPNENKKGTRVNRNVIYGDEELGSVDLNDLGDVTYKTIISDGQKMWK